MKRLIEIAAMMLLLPGVTAAQDLYNDDGHIPASKQVEWHKAGLTVTPPTTFDHLFDVTDFGASPNDGYDDTELGEHHTYFYLIRMAAGAEVFTQKIALLK